MTIESNISLWKYLSLSALLVLLGIYLTDVYQSQRDQVSKEARYIFLNSFDHVRGDALERMIESLSQDTLADSISIMSYETQGEDGQKHAMMRLKVVSDSLIFDQEWKEGHETSEIEELLNREEGFKLKFIGDSNFTGEVDDQFQSRIEKAGLKIKYDIIYKDSADVTAHSNGVDLDEHLEITVEQSSMEILKNMWREILFALVVLVIVALSFYYLEKSYYEQIQLNQARHQFVQNMTHELKSPVSAISLALEAMESFSNEDEKQRKEYIHSSRKEVARLDRLIDHVMNLTKIRDTKSDDLNKELISLSDVLKEIEDHLKISFPEKQIGMTASGLAVDEVYANRNMLHAILYNLLENAVKYNDHAGVQIELMSKKREAEVIIDIVDNGPGIDSEMAPFVFERFFRGQKGNVYDVSGHGLGLSLAREYARNMGGDLALVQGEFSKDYPGAHFQLTLPKN